jgi:tRNA pseudouridine32 synthase/23S rRNA pseudouridine746 synthase
MEACATSRAPTPSWITLPPQQQPYPTLLEFFDRRFPFVGRDVWAARLRQGKVCDEQGRAVDINTPYQINARLSYFREVEHEPRIPFQEQILFHDRDILIADKPHFLPVTPSGRYVNE